jgi:hypothetical protein
MGLPNRFEQPFRLFCALVFFMLVTAKLTHAPELD